MASSPRPTSTPTLSVTPTPSRTPTPGSHESFDSSQQCILAMLGNTCAGKTVLSKKVTNPRSPQKKDILIDKKKISVELYDIGGNNTKEMRQHIMKAQGFIIVYNICNASGIKEASIWRDKVVLLRGTVPPIMFVGNQSDMEGRRKIQTIDGRKLALSHGCLFAECSAKTGVGVMEAVETIVQQALTIEKEEIQQIAPKENHSCCCVM